ncbi:Signal transduction histidine kinase [Desulfitobacterium hafniense]|uniref:histidine kinase n=1 Tax=Desulfitobacterium hafniense TaxID=49338 RepID=A0A098AZ96_DESHA|nr:sensor histidine kinase [Desulfitobacterium hafniense]CDX01908.1 Signal transduction histidine kinase [Desulfitobacterium hafniense]
MNRQQLIDLCKEYTDLTDLDTEHLISIADKLPYIANLNETDIFIDALNRNGKNAIVLAWARPGSRSLYKRSVVGELAYDYSEPAVLRSLKTGEAYRNIRGESQEGVPIAQTVVPISNSERKIIGVLIMERDISEEIRQEKQVQFLSRTAEQLSNTLMHLSMDGHKFGDWLGNGIFILNGRGKITYANTIAAQIYRTHNKTEEPAGCMFDYSLINCSSMDEMLAYLKEPVEYAVNKMNYLFQAFPLVAYGELSGSVISVQDITDLRKKEQELNAQSIILKEIHHRVKNNLQNIAALLRLQMRRSDSELIRQEFEASINRIISIAIVHEVFAYDEWDYINVTDFLNRLLTFLVDSITSPEHKITTQIDGEGILLKSSQAVPLALVLNELLSNSLKHGLSQVAEGKLKIVLQEKEDRVNILISDNGPGYDPNSLQSPKRLGLQIVYSLVEEQLQGRFRIKRTGTMTQASVSFPILRTKEVHHE